MKALIAIACGAIAAACGSNKPAEAPAHYAEGDSTTVTMRPADAPRRNLAPDYGDSSAPSDPANSARSSANGRTASSELSTFRAIPPPTPPTMAPAFEPDAVVTKKNQAGATPTPVKQGSSDVDLMLTQQIRKSVSLDSSLSATARNIEIITQGGKVTLRGVVTRDEERQSIDASARKIAGAGNVDDQLEVAK